jgi:hypothetical protein
MKYSPASISTFLLIGVLAAAPARAQPASGPGAKRVGVGIAISDASEVVFVGSSDTLGAGLLPTFFVPIDLTSRFRVEPEFSGFRDSYTHHGTTADDTHRRSLIQVGTGAFGLARTGRFALYYGGRVAYLRSRLSSIREPDPARESVSQNSGWLFAPAVGAELYLTEYLSIGGETSLKFISWSGQSTSLSTSGTSLSSHGALTLRFYFPR